MNNATILYVEDDQDLAFLTREALEDEGYEVKYFSNGNQALHYIQHHTVDVCILDVMLPEIHGFDIATKIRSFNKQVPIIFLTAKTLQEDKIHGLKIGADDYITKPFEMEELLLKTSVFLKRRNIIQPKKDIISIRSFQFDPYNLSLRNETENFSLTQRESDLLELIYQHRGEVIKREVILEAIWGKNDYFLGRSMDVFISRLRKFFKSDPEIKIENVHGIGFRFYY